MAGGSGGAWKVAYGLHNIPMMAFFMVMWLLTPKRMRSLVLPGPLGTIQNQSESFSQSIHARAEGR